jgi:hypothetical protein
LGSLVVGGSRRSWRLRAPRDLDVGSPPNKPMHPTADTLAVELLHLAGRRVIGGVRLLE